MGVISELLENDKDGRLRRHIFRAASLVGYVAVVAVVLFLSGMIWRLFSGAEVEIFGVHVANPVEQKDKAARPAAASGPAPTTRPAAAGGEVFASHAWTPVGLVDFEGCRQAANEAMNRAQLSGIQRNPYGFIGTLRREGATLSTAQLRCMDVNGLALAFVMAYGPGEPANVDLMETLLRELSLRNGGVSINTLGGPARALMPSYYWAPSKLETAEACRKQAMEAMSRNRASNLSEARSAVFGAIDNTRVTILCQRDAGGLIVGVVVDAFSVAEADRVRDLIRREFTPLERPIPP